MLRKTYLKFAKTQCPDVVIVNDAPQMTNAVDKIRDRLKQKPHNINITTQTLNDHRELKAFLAGLKRDPDKPPPIFLLDVVNVGMDAAQAVIKWHRQENPRAPLPEIHFASTCWELSVAEAKKLRQKDPRFSCGFVMQEELNGMLQYLDKPARASFSSANNSLRALLNKYHNTAFPLTTSSRYRDKMYSLKNTEKENILGDWQTNQANAAPIIEQMRSYALNLADSVQTGLYFLGEDPQNKTNASACFYESTGFPVKGKVIFSPDDIKNHNDLQTNLILVMSCYDPDILPLLEKRKIQGLVCLSPYMGDHLKFLCESHMVSGVFGLKPDHHERLAVKYNELSKPEITPWTTDKTLSIGTTTIEKGQEIVIVPHQCGIICDPKDIPQSYQQSDMHQKTSSRNIRAAIDVQNIQKLNQYFQSWFQSQNQKAPVVKVNIDSAEHPLGKHAAGIGLVRTEQMVSGQKIQKKNLITYLLKDKQIALKDLINSITYDYEKLCDNLWHQRPVRIRLFDIAPRELMTKKEQIAFFAKHHSLDIHGGKAVQTWPELYQQQIRAIISAYNIEISAEPESPSPQPIEIMMPAINTKADVLAIKKMVTVEAKAQGLERKHYKFGVMIETLQSCDDIEQIVPHCDFISFGSNDLTQDYFAITRGDLIAQSHFKTKHGYNPFQTMAPEILNLIKATLNKARKIKPKLIIDICGAQAADIAMAETLFNAGIDSISAAPTAMNMMALPARLNYHYYDRLHNAGPANRPNHKQTPPPPEENTP